MPREIPQDERYRRGEDALVHVTQIRLSARQMLWLDELRQATGHSISHLIRTFIDQDIEGALAEYPEVTVRGRDREPTLHELALLVSQLADGQE